MSRRSNSGIGGIPLVGYGGFSLGTIIQCKDTDTSLYCQLAKFVNSLIMILMVLGIIYFLYYLYRTYSSKSRR